MLSIDGPEALGQIIFTVLFQGTLPLMVGTQALVYLSVYGLEMQAVSLI